MADTVDEIAKIPAFMLKKNWKNAASLMNEWFSADGNSNPERGTPDVDIIRMDTWVLTFQRARDVYEAMVRERIWMNDSSQKQIRLLLQRKGLLRSKGATKFGNLSAPMQVIHADQINVRQVVLGSLAPITDPLDDMFGALGRFNIDISVEGVVASLPAGGYQVSIVKVGFYIRDKYDFNGDQTLDIGTSARGKCRSCLGLDIRRSAIKHFAIGVQRTSAVETFTSTLT